jgi:hypothetical protein
MFRYLAFSLLACLALTGCSSDGTPSTTSSNASATVGAGANENRFFPSLVRGDVQLFALDSDPAEPDGYTADSKQARWLQASPSTGFRTSSTAWAAMSCTSSVSLFPRAWCATRTFTVSCS